VGCVSLIPLGVSVGIAALEGLISPVLIRTRSIGSFIADVTVEEHAEDEVEITQIPVESGAAVTDHAYKRPARLTILECQEIIFVTTATVTVPPAAQQQNPAATAPVNPVGQKPLQPATSYVP